jgi:hypothetical protein
MIVDAAERCVQLQQFDRVAAVLEEELAAGVRAGLA